MKKLLFLVVCPITLFAQSSIKSEIIGKWKMRQGWAVCDGKRSPWTYHNIYIFNSDGTYSNEEHQGNDNSDTSLTTGKYKWIGNKVNFYDNDYELNHKKDVGISIGDGVVLEVSFKKGELYLSETRKNLDGCPYTYIFSRVK